MEKLKNDDISPNEFFKPNPWTVPYRVGSVLHLFRDCRDMKLGAYPYPEIDPNKLSELKLKGYKLCHYCIERIDE